MLMSHPLMSSCWVVLWTLIYFYKNPSCWHTCRNEQQNIKACIRNVYTCGEIWKPNISLGAATLPISLPIILALFMHIILPPSISTLYTCLYTHLRVTGCTSFLAMENEFSLSLSSQGFPVWLQLGFHQSSCHRLTNASCVHLRRWLQIHILEFKPTTVIQNVCNIGGSDLKSRSSLPVSIWSINVIEGT